MLGAHPSGELAQEVSLPFSIWLPAKTDWSLEEKAAAQEVVLGVSLVAHPLELASRPDRSCWCSDDPRRPPPGLASGYACWHPPTWRRSRTPEGANVYFLAIEDLEGMLDVVVHEEVYRRYRQAFRGMSRY